MTDLATLKQSYNLLDQVPGLKKIGPRYYAGPCPHCGGTDRFQLKETDNGWIWVCRHCSPDGRNGKKYQDAIEYLAMQHNLNIHDGTPAQRYAAMQEITRLMGGAFTTDRPAPRPVPIPEPAHAPAADWQTAAYEIMHICQNVLYKHAGTNALAWLTGPERLLTHSMLETWNIGYSIGFEHAGVWVPRGVVIPCFEYGDVWYLKIRMVPGDKYRCVKCKAESTQPGKCACGQMNKYRGVNGNVPGLFGAGTLNGSDTAIVSEGEFDAMHLWAAVGKLDHPTCNRTAVITTGASSHFIDPVTWGRLGLMGINKFICIHDQDQAGDAAYEHMRKITARAARATFPEMTTPVKDVTDYVKAGGNLTAWLSYQMEKGENYAATI